MGRICGRSRCCMPSDVRGTHFQLRLEWGKEGVEKVQKEAIRFLHDRADTIIDKGREYDRPGLLSTGDRIDSLYYSMRLLKCRHEWHGHRAGFDTLELSQQCLPQCFGRDARAIRDEA